MNGRTEHKGNSMWRKEHKGFQERKTKMKKTLAFFIALAAVFASTMPLMADTETVGSITWTYRIVDNMAEIYGSGGYEYADRTPVGCSGPAISKYTSGIIYIPSSLGGSPVVSIGGWAFCDCKNITNVIMPECVTNIGRCAFALCSSLKSVVFSTNVRSIEDFAFYGCAGMTGVTIPDKVERIGSSAFSSCTSLSSLTICDGVMSIAASAFSGCTALRSVRIPDSVISVASSVFSGCSSSLFDETSIPGVKLLDGWVIDHSNSISSTLDLTGVRGIADNAFQNCSELTSVTLSGSLMSIGRNAFSGCNNVIFDMETIPGVKLLGAWAIGYVGTLTNNLDLTGVKGIANGAFSSWNSNLVSVEFSSDLEYIGSSAFTWNTKLFSVTIPSSVKSIGTSAFPQCCLFFEGEPPRGIAGIAQICACVYRQKEQLKWESVLNAIHQKPFVRIQSASIRGEDPTIMDITFAICKSGMKEFPPVVRGRFLAFEDGVRDFAKVMRPETFVDNTVPFDLNAIEANRLHALSWKVSSDWATRLAKVKSEVLTLDNDLLPVKLRTIPASEQYGKMKISLNTITDTQVFNALLWQYADKDSGLSLSNGVLRNGATQLASGTSVSGANATQYVFTKMGFDGVLSGARLNYANRETRLGLSPSGARQYAYKIVEE